MARRWSFDQRAYGLLLHPTSLPGPHGSGDLGPAAEAFVDFLAAAGAHWWQMLPVNPVGPGNSPYSPFSALAGNPLLISLERLAADGLLTRDELRPPPRLPADRVPWSTVTRFRLARLRRAFARWRTDGGPDDPAFQRFCAAEGHWLEDWALFASVRRAYENLPWTEWPRPLRQRTNRAVRQARADLADELAYERFLQFAFERQWQAVRAYAHERGVGLIGDLPIFVAHDSADVWANPSLFQLDAAGRCTGT